MAAAMSAGVMRLPSAHRSNMRVQHAAARSAFCSAPAFGSATAISGSAGLLASSKLDARKLDARSPRGRAAMHVRAAGQELSTREKAQNALSGVERTIRQTVRGSGKPVDGRWQEVEGAWVLRPPAATATPTVAVVHFIGGAFVGASPEIAYRTFLECLAARGCVVVVTPFATQFDQMRIADEVQYKWDRCMGVIAGEVEGLPVYGLGHSMGALIHMLLCARYNMDRAGNILMSYNNNPVNDVIPLFSPIVSPVGQAVGPILDAFLKSPLAGPTDFVTGFAKDISPPIVRQVIPLLEQLQPLALDVASGRQDFSPSPEEARRLMQEFYSVRRNLLIRFSHDTIDDTVSLSNYLQESAAVHNYLEMTVHTLPGTHVRPLQQVMPDIPTPVHKAGAFGGDVLTGIAGVAEEVGLGESPVGSLVRLTKQVGEFAHDEGTARARPEMAKKDLKELALEISHWMGISSQ